MAEHLAECWGGRRDARCRRGRALGHCKLGRRLQGRGIDAHGVQRSGKAAQANAASSTIVAAGAPLVVVSTASMLASHTRRSV